MGNQAQVHEGATVMSTSTRNFPNRLGKNTFVYLGSAELAAICSKLGKIPTVEEYQANIGIINEQGDQIYRYMNFNEIDSYNEVAETVNVWEGLVKRFSRWLYLLDYHNTFLFNKKSW